jgi:hypothetical protein
MRGLVKRAQQSEWAHNEVVSPAKRNNCTLISSALIMVHLYVLRRIKRFGQACMHVWVYVCMHVYA